MRYQAVIFDLDGTLLDTLADIADSANLALANHGFPTHAQQAYQQFVGSGARRLIMRALPKDKRLPRTIEMCLQSFIADYHIHWNRATCPYDGIPDLLSALQTQGIQLSVVTNKPHGIAKAMIAHYFQNTPFFPVLGQQEGIPKKPDPQQALVAAGQMGVEPSACVFLGDSAVDMETAKHGGMLPVGAKWGFRTVRELRMAGAAAVLDQPLDLLQFV